MCQVTSSLKFILAVYEDKHGFAYREREYSRSEGRSASKNRTAAGESGGGSKGFQGFGRGDEGEGEGERLGREGGREREGGLSILREVQWSVKDEAIELEERPAHRTGSRY